MSHYRVIFTIARLWKLLLAALLIMFSVLLFFRGQIYQQAPPIPAQVISSTGQVLFNQGDILRGQAVWQSLGGMEKGSIWGHGSYLAPDWSADWLHREAEAWLDLAARNRFGKPYVQLSGEQQEGLKLALRQDVRANRYNAQTGQLTLSAVREQAMRQTAMHFSQVFQNRDTTESRRLRNAYAFAPQLSLSDSEQSALNAFFFWTAWATVTNRPADSISYTSNWPYEPLVGNTPSPALFIWSMLSVLALLAGIGALVWFYARQYDAWRDDLAPEEGVARHNLLEGFTPTPSMRATAKFFWTAMALLGLQVGLGIVTAHYAVEGQTFYGLPLAQWLPYTVSRTWHTQLGIFWIATTWLATGLYVAPLIGGREPKWQSAGANFLYLCLLIIVLGSFAGEWLGAQHYFSNLTLNFWFGHQGYEYVDLGRFWQIFLFIGLLLWVGLMLRALWPALQGSQDKSLLWLLVLSTLAIGLLYGAGLAWGQHTSISIMEYWRWWVVHLWVEGVFEVFATAIIALLFVRMGLVRHSTATVSVLFAAIIFLSAGVLGTFHHLYFSGTPIAVLALGSVFSALEVVPLTVIGFEAYSHARIEKQAEWLHSYRWPLRFFAAVLFWNLVGAGLLGFLINPPLSLYYMQGLNTTATHGHAALFGVYGMLGIGLMLFCLRGLTPASGWNSRLPRIAFWGMNIGLALMLVLSLLPQGLWQAYNSYAHGYWFARSAEFIHSRIMEWLVWGRVPGDTVFAVGVAALLAFLLQLYRKPRGDHPGK